MNFDDMSRIELEDEIIKLRGKLDQYQKVADAAKEYMSVHDEFSNKQLEENLLIALVELNE